MALNSMKMTAKKWLNGFPQRMTAILLVFFLLAGIFYWIVKDGWTNEAVVTESVSRGAMVGEFIGDKAVEQTFTPKMEQLQSLTVSVSRWGQTGDEWLDAEILNGSEVLASFHYASAEIPEDGSLTLSFDSPLRFMGKELILRLLSSGNLSVWYGTEKNLTRGAVQLEIEGSLTVGSAPLNGMLVLSQQGVNGKFSIHYYWYAAGMLGLLLAGFCIWVHLRGGLRNAPGLRKLFFLYDHYADLLRQLIRRDFKVKYKASMLGALWSVLNPVLQTGVYYIVFSTLFHSDVEHFIVYLMSGAVLFNYFSESSNLGLVSIVGNASLIKKVYVPKFIYPISKVLSSSINLLLSYIPLFLLMLLDGIPFTRSLLLIPFVICSIILFSIGMSLILSTADVFFRDIEFLWSVLITMWNFLTPIFYPESIIPAALQPIYHLNPLYQILHFQRMIIIDGVTPPPSSYLYCVLAWAIPLAIGFIVFRRHQNKFAVNL